MNHSVSRSIRGALLLLAAVPGIVLAQRAQITLEGTFRDVGAAPAPTANFSLAFDVDRSPLVCGAATGASLVCGASKPVYANGPIDLVLSQGGDATLLFRDASVGGGFLLFQDDVLYNRLGFTVSSAQLFSGLLSSPTLVNGVYPIFYQPCVPNEQCDYLSFAGQGFASGDVINNPFSDPVTLQSYDPIVFGTVTIEDHESSVPEPSSVILLPTGLLTIVGTVRARHQR